jgi:hypothetical protein
MQIVSRIHNPARTGGAELPEACRDALTLHRVGGVGISPLGCTMPRRSLFPNLRWTLAGAVQARLGRSRESPRTASSGRLTGSGLPRRHSLSLSALSDSPPAHREGASFLDQFHLQTVRKTRPSVGYLYTSDSPFATPLITC